MLKNLEGRIKKYARNIILTGSMLLAAGIGTAQNQITGTVRTLNDTSSGAPIENFEVKSTNTGLKTFTTSTDNTH